MFSYERRHGQKRGWRLTANYYYDVGTCFGGSCLCSQDTRNDGTPYAKLAHGRLTVSKGYTWNGADWFPDRRWVMRASLVHDALIQVIASEKDRHKLRLCADREFYCIVSRDKGKSWAARLYSALRGHAKCRYIGGATGFLSGSERKIPKKIACGREVSRPSC